ncbi:hypothetical protein PSC74_13330 [Aeromonas hydrophila]|uniref:hypothetical protein n=1 Tax=Aeromonas hydrophila TaxID=644 RepID=UPI00235EE896|nr:hypothetical protein [Aeromonas hydrophila]WDA23038.1 hypothetical protein PSC74_13330 [Aeromonas hydrophila]WES93101.1 hypothetical protein PY368_22020 [Aeromonas hydrophila]
MILPFSLRFSLFGLCLATAGCTVEPYAYQCGDKQCSVIDHQGQKHERPLDEVKPVWERNQEREEAIRRNKESIWREKTPEERGNYGAGATISW